MPYGAAWRWLRGVNEASQPPTAWRQPAFNDSAWAVGAMPFYYGATGASAGTRLADMRNGYTTLFLRRTFVVADPASVGSLTLHEVIDDGLVVWINGTEVQRFNVPAGEVPYNAGTPVAIGSTPVTVSTNFVPAAGLLAAGTNLLAVQGVNRNLTSSDFHLDLELRATRVTPGPPTIAAVSPAPGATVSGLTHISVAFSKPVLGVEAADLRVNGRAAVGLETNAESTVFTFALNPLAPGTVEVTWREGHGIRSPFGEPFDAAAPGASWTYTLVPPAALSAAPPPGAVVEALTEVRVTFNAPVSGVRAADLLVNGRPAGTVVGEGDGWTFGFSQPEPGLVTITLDSNHEIADLTGARLDEAAGLGTWWYTLADTQPPTMRQTTPPAGARVSRLTQCEVYFSEPVRGVDAADLWINGVPAARVRGLGAGPYIFEFAEPAPGLVHLSWQAGHGITDLATPAQPLAGEEWTVWLDPAVGAGEVILNEFVASNQSGLKDEDGEPQDWIELFNPGARPVNLEGWALTDDPDQPDRWIFPAVTLEPGRYLVVFASGKDRRAPGPGQRLHTNFRLDDFGEYLALFNPESPRRALIEFRPRYPEQRADHAYGRSADGPWRYFPTPTPGAANGPGGLEAVAPEPQFSVRRGWFDEPFHLLLSASLPGAQIRYTVDGTIPTATTGFPVTGPLWITNTVILRAGTFAPGLLPSRPVTQTYLFLESVMRQPPAPPGFPAAWGAYSSFPNNLVPADYEMDPDPLRVDPLRPDSPVDPAKWQRLREGLLELPVLSLAMAPTDLFGPAGLYDAANIVNKAFPQKPCSVELVLPDGRTAFATAAGIEGHGNASREPRKNPKHGFKLNFRGEFGPGRLEYPLFPDSPVRWFDDLILRPDFNASWRHWSDTPNNGNGAYQRRRATRTRDAWVKHTFRDLGHAASHNRYVHLFLNGLYWGLYDLSEQPTRHFGAAYFGGNDTDYDAYDQGRLRAGTPDIYNAMLALTNLVDNARYEQMKQYLDLPQYLDYVLLHFFIGHQDWGLNKNWHALRPRGPGGTFKFFPWDGECVLLNEDVNRVANPDVAAGLHTRLRDNAQYRLDFADRVHRHLLTPGGALTREACEARWLYWSNLLDRAIVAESCRWGDYRRDVHPYSEGTYELYTRETHWLPEHRRLVTSYFVNRPGIVLAQLRAAGLYPELNAPEFRLHDAEGPPTAGGTVPAGTVLALRNPDRAGTMYFTTNGADPRVVYAGTVAPAARAYTTPLTLETSLVLKARLRAGANWSALAEAVFTVAEVGLPLALTEINYHPPGGEAFEFVELHNFGVAPVDLSGFSFRGLDFVFPERTTLPPGGVLVLANRANPAAFAARYPGTLVAGWFSGALANEGERLALADRNGRVVLAAHYDDENGWPASADGGGPTLELVDVRADPNAPAHWRPSPRPYGSPGLVPPPPPPAGPVVLSEIMADNAGSAPRDGTFPDWIELHNRGEAAVDLGGWSLSDNSDPRRYVLPPGTTLPAGAFLVIWCDAATAPGLHTGFALNRRGESLFLYDAATNRVDAVSFGLQLPDYTLGRFGETWQLAQPTPGAANQPAPLAGPTNLCLNEWLADSPPGAEDWLELHNRAAAPVSLEGLIVETAAATARLRSRSFIGPGGFVRLWADERPGADHLELKLPAAGGSLTLRAATGELIDQVRYGPQLEGVSEGRLPDGAEPGVRFPDSPSPEAPNYLPTWSGPVLNEILVLPGPGSEPSSAWVELFNPAPESFDLTGLGLGNGSSPTPTWVFPTGTLIPAGGFLLVECDPARPISREAGPRLNAGLALAASGGTVTLCNARGQRVDAVTYGLQIPGRSLGRDPAGAWQLLSMPTPAAANATPAALGPVSALRINEWLVSPLEGEDWFELYNPADRPVALGGLWLTDSPALPERTKHRLAPLSFIAPGGWALFLADDQPARGPRHVAFRLAAGGESLRLYDANLRLLDAVDFGAQEPGRAEGRLPDGSPRLVRFADAGTPGTANLRADLDSDGDGLPDAWEHAQGTLPDVPDADADADGDGATNRAEYLAGTEPVNAASVLRLEVSAPSPAGLQLHFVARPERAYRVEHASELPARGWAEVHLEPAAPAERTVTLTVPPPESPGFYRLLVLPGR